MECKECKYVTECNGAFFCMGQKNMPYVTGNGVCERWKPKYITNYDRFISKSPEELAMILQPICPTDATCPDELPHDCYSCWLDWLQQEAEDG